MTVFKLLLRFVFALAVIISLTGLPARADEIDFNREVKPILANRWYQCHGPDESSREADLRLDRFEDATASAIEPGQPDISN